MEKWYSREEGSEVEKNCQHKATKMVAFATILEVRDWKLDFRSLKMVAEFIISWFRFEL